MNAAAAAIVLAVISPPQNVQITVYNQNFAVVREERTIELKPGINWAQVEDVPAHIDPTSVHFVSTLDPNGLVIREQNYEYDLISPVSVINKSVGKQVTFRQYTQQGMHETTGTLLNPATMAVPRTGTSRPRPYYGWSSQTFAGSGISRSGQPLGLSTTVLALKTKDGILLNPQGEVLVREMPRDLVSRPRLKWKLEARQGGKHRAELSYLTGELNWQADYVAIVNAKEDAVDLSGWVTLENHAGTRFEQAGLQLMAGDVRRVQPERGGRYAYALAAPEPGMGGMAPQFAEQPFFEYHLYTLAGKTTIGNNETKQLSLLTANDVPVRKVYLYDAQREWWWRWIGGSYRGRRPGEGRDTAKQTKVHVMLELDNSKENNLGMPLPKGKVRVYKADDQRRLQFLGEDQIDHTPQGEKLRLWIGDAFDLVGEHKRTNFTKIAANVTEETFEIALRNHKQEPVTVSVVEHVPGSWQMLEKSHPFKQKDAHTIEFNVPVEPDKQAKVTYRVRITW